MSDLECPYCGAGNDVNHDDGFGYDEDRRHEMACGSCDKEFVFYTYISFSYRSYKADCLNGSAHRLELSATYPKRFAKWRCQDCDYEKGLSDDEQAAIAQAEGSSRNE